MVLRYKMSHVALFIIGVMLVLVMIKLIFSGSGLLSAVIFGVLILMIFSYPAVILPESFSSLFSSSAAPPACLDSFIVETNGGTGEAYTCTPLNL